MPTPLLRASVQAQAKINLTLRVLDPDETGYHAIETVFQRLALADDVTVTMRPQSERRLTCDVDVGAETDNLAYRAAEAFLMHAEWRTGFAIDLAKQIPARGGLGGGSADAAAVLRALNALAPAPLDTDALLRIAATIGADVPFLTSDLPIAIGRGYGERLETVPALPHRYVALVVPPFGMSTAAMYLRLDQRRRARPLAISPHVDASDVRDWDAVARKSENDFTAVAEADEPDIGQYIAALRAHGAQVANLSGSGSVVFGIFDVMPNAAALTRTIGCDVVVTTTADRVASVRLAFADE